MQITSRTNSHTISLQRITVSISVIYTIIFPADKLNIKEILLFIALLTCLPAISHELQKRNDGYLFFYSLLYPVCCIFYSILMGDSTVGDAFSYGYVWIYLLLIPGIVHYNVDIKKVFLFATFIVAGVINFIYLSDVFGIISIFSNPVVIFLKEMNEIQYGKGIVATFGYSIFYKPCPLIIFSYGYTLFKKKYFLAAFFFLSMIACGTRANFYATILVTVLILLFTKEKKSKKFVVIVLLIAAAVALGPTIIEKMVNLTNIKVDSDSIKTKHIASIFEYMNEAPYRYVFGSGVGSSFYTSGIGKYTTVVEVSYFDYFRQVGFVGFILFSVFIIRPMKWLFHNERWMLFVYIAYLAIAFTNPLLVTSTSFMGYVLILSNGMGDKRVSLMDHKNMLCK